MAFYKFVSAILESRPFGIYHHGEISRDFTFIDNLVHGVSFTIDVIPPHPRRGYPYLRKASLLPHFTSLKM